MISFFVAVAGFKAAWFCNSIRNALDQVQCKIDVHQDFMERQKAHQVSLMQKSQLQHDTSQDHFLSYMRMKEVNAVVKDNSLSFTKTTILNLVEKTYCFFMPSDAFCMLYEDITIGDLDKTMHELEILRDVLLVKKKKEEDAVNACIQRHARNKMCNSNIKIVQNNSECCGKECYNLTGVYWFCNKHGCFLLDSTCPDPNNIKCLWITGEMKCFPNKFSSCWEQGMCHFPFCSRAMLLPEWQNCSQKGTCTLVNG